MIELTPVNFGKPWHPALRNKESLPPTHKLSPKGAERDTIPDQKKKENTYIYYAFPEDPFEVTDGVRKHVANLKMRHDPKTQMKTAIVIFRSLIPSDRFFRSRKSHGEVGYSKYLHYGLPEAEGGLGVRYERTPELLLRKDLGDLLPDEIMAIEKKDRKANCSELSYLLVVCLRAAGIEAYIKAKPRYASGAYGHVYVIARIDDKWHKLDPSYLTFSKTQERGMSDRQGTALHYLNEGRIFSRHGKIEEALAAYEQANVFDPDCAAPWNNKGVLLMDQGKLEEAGKCFERALKIEPRYVFAWHNKGRLFKKMGKAEEAKRYFEKALGYKPDLAAAWHNIGIILMGQGKLEEAGKCYEKALEIEPRYVYAWHSKGTLLEKQGKIKEAKRCFDRALAIKADCALAWNSKGGLLEKQGKLVEALKCYEKATNIDPKYIPAWFNLGVLLEKQGKLEEAVKSYDKILELRPDYVYVLYRKGEVLAKEGKLKESLEFFEAKAEERSHF